MEEYQSETLHSCSASLDSNGPQDYREVAALLAQIWRRHNFRCIGIGGGQGAGKTTLSALVAAAGAFYGERVQVLSIDDFYFTKQERKRLAKEVHPLLATRGPPGTHDLSRLLKTIKALLDGRSCVIPQFNKGSDDREGELTVSPGVDRVIVEGWCVGVTTPKHNPRQALNTLERTQDFDATWRNYILDQVHGTYAQLRACLDCLVYLEVPGMDAVRKWRLQQEEERPVNHRMTAQEVAHFVEHYERVTKWMLADVPSTAALVLKLDSNHRVIDITLRV